MTEGTYSKRHAEELTVKSIERYKNGGAAITADNGWTAGAPAEVARLLDVGKRYVLETVQFSRITGWMVDGEWIVRKTDEDLERERQEMIARHDAERRERLAANRAEWQKRQDALPEWVRSRIEHFHAAGGENFEVDGWGYELVVAELAALYGASGGEDNAEVNAYAEREGTSGNQHDMAKALARAHREEPAREMAGTVSALSPITGDAFYEGRD